MEQVQCNVSNCQYNDNQQSICRAAGIKVMNDYNSEFYTEFGDLCENQYDVSGSIEAYCGTFKSKNKTK